ncbi:2-hydroxyacid dehydrogenase [Paenibacillus beijingensis]|uniref:2-hydroxyacid dehydrogenase n=1 Tax=Paenibacillus beijingensis TaxID=1126833 RepID=UPI000696D102|nr:NAD(P)-dependent oxidoreductase [Paenibacillus beijingensis]
MSKKAVLITAMGRGNFTPEQAARLERAGQITYIKSLEPIPPAELAALLMDADVAGLTPRSVPSIDASWIEQLPKLRGIAVFATGVDYIDVELLEERGIKLSNLPEYSTVSVAEHTIGMLLTMSRRIHLSQDRVRGRVPFGTSVKGWELRGRTIGLIGLGRIGRYVSELAQAFGMRVVGYDPIADRGAGVTKVSLEELLASSDVVSLHYPSKWKGAHHFGQSQLRQMKPGSYLINVSRSALVDDAAVVASIEAGYLKGYAVDDRFSLAGTAAADRLVAEGRILQTGHTAWYSEEVIERGYETWADNVIGLLTDRPQHLVTAAEERSGRFAE